MVVHTTKETEGIPAPTISVFPYSQNNSAFRLSTEAMEEMYDGDLPCDDYLTKHTFNQSEALIDIFLGYTRKLSLLDNNETIVTEEMLTPSIGRYYVFRQTILLFYRLIFLRLGVEPSGTTGVTRAHPFVLIANNTGGKITLRILCFFQNHGRLK